MEDLLAVLTLGSFVACNTGESIAKADSTANTGSPNHYNPGCN